MVYTIVSLQQDEFRMNRFYFIPSISAFCRYASKVARLSSYRDQALTHRQSDRHTDILQDYYNPLSTCSGYKFIGNMLIDDIIVNIIVIQNNNYCYLTFELFFITPCLSTEIQ